MWVMRVRFVLQFSHKLWLIGVLFCLVTFTACTPQKSVVESKAKLPQPEISQWQEEMGGQMPLNKSTAEPEPLVEKHHTLAAELREYAASWLGTPHRMGGNSKSGVDCSGLTCLLYRDVFGHQFASRSSADLYKECDPVSLQELQPGDLVFFKIRGNRIDHVGVYLDGGEFVHASVRKGVMINRLDEPYYQKTFYKGGRPKLNP